VVIRVSVIFSEEAADAADETRIKNKITANNVKITEYIFLLVFMSPTPLFLFKISNT
jgi:hypothetical protein